MCVSFIYFDFHQNFTFFPLLIGCYVLNKIGANPSKGADKWFKNNPEKEGTFSIDNNRPMFPYE